jgi:osmoprotectant transport system permease protein
VNRRRLRGFGVTLAASVVFAAVLMRPDLWQAFLARFAPDPSLALYPTGTPMEFVLAHIELVLVSSGLTILIGLPLGIFATRPSGAQFRELISAAVDLGQTFPPVAVLALALPILGFGFTPTIAALVLYGLFPVVSGTIAGIESVPSAVLDAARGMGMGPRQILLRVELPLAAHLILGGIRTSVIINIGTATVGAAVGADGLGVPIIGGLVGTQNVAYVLEGAIPAAILAILADSFLGQLEAAVTPAETGAA